MIYEYRRYVVIPGRMADLQARFRDRTLQIWKRLGFRPVAFWDPVVGVYNEFHYMLAWEDMGERQRKWDAFAIDPEWLEVRAASESHGPLVASVENQLWALTDFSPGDLV